MLRVFRLLSALVAATGASPPLGLRVDYTAVTFAVPHPFVTLDAVTGGNPNVTLTWELAPGSQQATWSATVTARGGAVPVWSSGAVASSAQAASFPRTLLAPATAYTWTVSVQPLPGSTTPWLTSPPSPFFTSAGAEHWAASAPVWARVGDGVCGPTPTGAPPAFARFYAEVALPAPAVATVQSALLFITGAPPVYKDPWNTTKLLGGYALRMGRGGMGPLLAIGPGRTACGPAPTPTCDSVQPFDGHDVTAPAAAAAALNETLPLHLESYSVPQPALGISPAVQAVLVIRFVNESAPPLVFGTHAGPTTAWLALNADAIRNPGANKATSWYVQPEENVNASCQVAPSPGPPPSPPSPPCCGWGPPVPAPAAWSNGAVRLAGKATQPLQVRSGVPPASVVQLRPGWWVADMGGEHQGGIEVALNASAAPGGALPATTLILQLGEELASNGSALWHLRAGCKYREVWTFPAVVTPPRVVQDGGAAVPSPSPTAALSTTAAHHEYSEFRWAEVIVLDAVTGAPLDVPLSAVGLSGWTVHYPYADESAARVSTSSPDLDAVWALAARTLKVTTLDLIADSNTRQRSPDCMADDTTALLSMYATTSELSLPRLVTAQAWALGPDGYTSSNWADWTVLPGLNIVYGAWASGDVAGAAAALPTLVANHTYINLVDPSTGLVHNGRGLGALVDTSGGSDDGFVPTEWNAVVQAWSYAGMTAVAALAGEAGDGATQALLSSTAAALKAGFNTYFFNGTAICDGRCALEPHTSVHSSFYALAFGLVDAASAPAVWEYVRVRALGGVGGAAPPPPPLGVPCGAYPVQFLVQALYANTSDHGRSAYAVLTSTAPHSWLAMMATWGATATMECWQPTELPNLSFSHVWSSSPSFLVPRYFFGLEVTSPGGAALSLRPQPGPVEAGQATLPTARGPVAVAFRQTLPGAPGGCFELTTTTPGGTVLRVYLPLWGAPLSSVRVSVDGTVAPGVTSDGDYAVVDGLAGGSHVVTTC